MTRLGLDTAVRGDGPAVLLRYAIEESSRSARQFAALLGVDERTVRKWLANDREIPGPVVLLCALISASPTVVFGLDQPASKREYADIVEVLDELRVGLTK